MEASPLLPFIRSMLSQPIRLHCCCCSQQRSWEKGHSPGSHGCFWLPGGSPFGLTIGLHTETLQTANGMETAASSADQETLRLSEMGAFQVSRYCGPWGIVLHQLNICLF